MQVFVAVERAQTSGAYRKLMVALASRAARMGSHDAEGAAQEALKRSLAHPFSRAAVEYYVQDDPPASVALPAWPLARLVAWLYGVTRFVVREETARVSHRCEVHDEHALQVPDSAPGPLTVLIDDQLQGIVRE